MLMLLHVTLNGRLYENRGSTSNGISADAAFHLHSSFLDTVFVVSFHDSCLPLSYTNVSVPPGPCSPSPTRRRPLYLQEMSTYQKRCTDLQTSEVSLREQLSTYTEKYEDFQGALAKSSKVFNNFKSEMEKVRLASEWLRWVCEM